MSEATLFDTEEGNTAWISADERYRFDLTRRWGRSERLATFVMLNPSTADASQDDPTIRRCIGFAKSWGCHGLRVVNLYAYRATQPRDLWLADDPVGYENHAMVEYAIRTATALDAPLVAAWGAHARPKRVAEVLAYARSVGAQFTALKVTKAGAPGHPLYIRADAALSPWPSPDPRAVRVQSNTDDRSTR